MEKQLFFSKGIQTPFKTSEQLIYEPFLQLGRIDDADKRMKRLERLLGVEPSKIERRNVLNEWSQQKQLIGEALKKGVVTAWVGPSAAEELAFMEMAELFSKYDSLRLRLIPGPLQMRERAPELFSQLEKQTPYLKEEWLKFVPAFSDVETGKLFERFDLFEHRAHEEDYFDAELLAVLKANGEPMRPEKLVAAAYAKRPEYPVPFYLNRLGIAIKKGHMLQKNNMLELATKLHS